MEPLSSLSAPAASGGPNETNGSIGRMAGKGRGAPAAPASFDSYLPVADGGATPARSPAPGSAAGTEAADGPLNGQGTNDESRGAPAGSSAAGRLPKPGRGTSRRGAADSIPVPGGDERAAADPAEGQGISGRAAGQRLATARSAAWPRPRAAVAAPAIAANDAAPFPAAAPPPVALPGLGGVLDLPNAGAEASGAEPAPNPCAGLSAVGGVGTHSGSRLAGSVLTAPASTPAVMAPSAGTAAVNVDSAQAVFGAAAASHHPTPASATATPADRVDSGAAAAQPLPAAAPGSPGMAAGSASPMDRVDSGVLAAPRSSRVASLSAAPVDRQEFGVAASRRSPAAAAGSANPMDRAAEAVQAFGPTPDVVNLPGGSSATQAASAPSGGSIADFDFSIEVTAPSAISAAAPQSNSATNLDLSQLSSPFGSGPGGTTSAIMLLSIGAPQTGNLALPLDASGLSDPSGALIVPAGWGMRSAASGVPTPASIRAYAATRSSSADSTPRAPAAVSADFSDEGQPLSESSGVLMGPPSNPSLTGDPHAENFAAPSPGAFEALAAGKSKDDKNSLNIDFKRVTNSLAEPGTGVADPSTVPTASSTAPRFSAEHSLAGSSHAAAAPAVGALAGIHPALATANVAATAVDRTLAANTAKAAVETVMSLADAQAARAEAAPAAVNLGFKFGNDHLGVRVELRSGQVHTAFTTNSAELRDALSTQFAALTSSGGAGSGASSGGGSDRTYQFASPQFSGSAPGGDQRGSRQNPPPTGAEFALEGFAAPARAALSSASSRSTTAAESTAGGALHLHAFA